MNLTNKNACESRTSKIQKYLNEKQTIYSIQTQTFRLEYSRYSSTKKMFGVDIFKNELES